jgi:putative membrane protein
MGPTDRPTDVAVDTVSEHGPSMNWRSRRFVWLVAAGVALVFVWSAIAPRERLTWWLEIFPVLIAVPLLVATARRFPLTDLAYLLIGIHACILLVGGHYTYAQVPAFNWLRDHLHLARNDYDRVGHFAQGFVPAILAREVLLRRSPLRRGKWLFAIVVAFCLAISALYELFEWLTALVAGSSAEAFLGTQGDPWDTQEDMATALVGAVLSLVLLSRVHDWQLRRLTESLTAASLPKPAQAST